ncbi:TetR family transcriptional regulator [Pseudomonas vanderleydeniana]|uniref:TetR family transcriptional regulator n=1 Tax=Pseudomonas vanderleydeniana TaxID=2745495 RepID=A0A9E6TQR8_9PSED|nr:TetR family transcriptional regulator [Pseudomonas vanderleydeniana]QXI26250.1 TetR family transcriptional regulator [Pseudomonas vanderleydeniana]
MARKPKEQSDKTYDLLLDAAEQVFSENGYANTTLQEIAERAGLTRGAIYWHFRDKAQLLDALLEDVQLPWDRLPKQFVSLEQAPSPKELGEIISQAVQETVDDSRQHRITLILLKRTEVVSDDHPAHRRLVAILDRIKNYLTVALSARFRQQDGTPHSNVPVAVAGVKAYVSGMVSHWVMKPAETDLTVMAFTIERLIFALFEPGNLKVQRSR